MNRLLRRQFFRTTGVAAAGLPLMGMKPVAGSDKKTLKRLSRAVKFTRDGIDMHPAEYTGLLSRLAAEENIPADNYSRASSKSNKKYKINPKPK